MDNKECRCPVCGKTEFESCGYWDVCFVCGWEDDGFQRNDPDLEHGANKMSLNQARQAYAEGREVF